MTYNKRSLLGYALTGCVIAVLIIVSVSFFVPRDVYEVPTPLVEVPPTPTTTPGFTSSPSSPSSTSKPTNTPPSSATPTPKEMGTETLNTGVLSIMVTDAPIVLRNLNITIDHFKVCNSQGEWFEIPVNGSVAYFDLLKLQNLTREVAVGELPAGNYTMVKMRILHANATLPTGEVVKFRVHTMYVNVSVHFEIKEGLKTIVILDIDLNVQTPILGYDEEVSPTVTATVIPPS